MTSFAAVLRLAALTGMIAAGSADMVCADDEQACLDGSFTDPHDTASGHLSMLQRRAAGVQSRFGSNGFSLPFGYTVLGPEDTIVTRLLVPVETECPAALKVSEKRGSVPVTVRAEPVLGESNFYIDGKRFNTMQHFDASVGNPHPVYSYADRVCEARFKLDGKERSSGISFAEFDEVDSKKIRVPLPPASPSRFLTVGDTGQRIKATNNGWCAKKMSGKKTLYHGKTCKEEDLLPEYNSSRVEGLFQRNVGSIDPAENGWPFGQVVSSMLHAQSDRTVVVHVGDFTYRHEACPFPFPKTLNAKQQKEHRVFGDCVGSSQNWGDTSGGWQAEFFEPAAALLQTAPWIVLRGNHEVCGRAGAGWFRYLEPRPLSDFGESASKKYPWCKVKTEPYAVDFLSDRWLIVDSNKITGEGVGVDSFPPLSLPELSAKKLTNSDVLPMDEGCSRSESSGENSAWMFANLTALVKPELNQRHWLGTHRPIFGVTYQDSGKKDSHAGPQVYMFTCQMQDAMFKLGTSVPRVAAIVSGHFHLGQLVEFEAERPTQVVLGNGGTQLATPRDGKPVAMSHFTGLGMKATGATISSSPTVGEFGFGELNMEADDAAKQPKVTLRFMSDATYRGSEAVERSLPLRTLEIKQSWYRQAQGQQQ